MTCNNVILAQPYADTNVNYMIPEGDSARLNFSPEDIAGLRIGGNGELIISFEDGGQLTITNFSELSDSGSMMYLTDGTLIDPAILTTSLQAPEVLDMDVAANTNSDPILIKQPSANSTQEVSMQAGQKYICDFDPANAATVELKDGQMVLTFADGSQVIINNYETAMAGELPAELTVADGTTVAAEELLTQVTEVAEPIEEILQVAAVEPVEPVGETLEIAQESTADDVANIEPAAGETDLDDMAALAEALGDIETAAGDEGGGSSSAGGYGFNSSATDAPLDSPDALGPLGATQLAYNAPNVNQENPFLPTAGAPTDDAPLITGAEDTLDETALLFDNLVAEGVVEVDFGNDGAGEIGPSGDFEATCELSNNVLTSAGVPVEVTATDNGYVGTAGGTVVFRFIIDSESGEYTYVQIESLDHGDTTDQNEAICLDFGIIATDADGDPARTNVRINILDDAPVIFSQVPSVVDETNFDGGDLTVVGQFVADMGSDIGGEFEGTGAFEASGSLPNNALTSNGQEVTVTYDNATATYTGSAGGETVFTLVLDPVTGGYTYTQVLPLDHADGTDDNDEILLTFGAEVTDFDGDSASGNITIRVLDDGPEAVNDVDSLGKVENIATGNILDNDDKGADVEGAEVCGVSFNGKEAIQLADGSFVISGDYGQLTVAPDGSYTYERHYETAVNGSGQAVNIYSKEGGVDVFDYIMKDGDGDTSPATITIDLAANATPIDINGVGQTDDTNLNDDGVDMITGVINVNYQGDDAAATTGNGSFSSSGNQVGNNLTSNGINVNVTFDATNNTYTGIANGTTVFTMVIHDDGTYTFTQNEPLDHSDTTDNNEEIFLDFGVTATDAEGDTGTGTVRITVLDDAPEANDDTLTIEDGETATGNVITNNDEVGADQAGTITNVQFEGTDYPVAADGTTTIEGNHGKLTIESNGDYSYVANEMNGGIVTDTSSFDATAADAAGTQNSVTKDGITISANNGGDISWFSDPDLGSGFGVTGGSGGNKVYGNESLSIDFASPVDTTTISLGDMGPNNIGDTFEYEVRLEDGSVINQTVTIDAANVVDGIFTFDIDGFDSPISGVDLVGGPSYVLSGVETQTFSDEVAQDKFTYTLVDADGDSDTAILDISTDNNPDPIDINGVGQTDDTNLNDGGVDRITGVINVNYQGDAEGETCGTGNFNASGNLVLLEASDDVINGGDGSSPVSGLASNGSIVRISFDADTNTYKGTTGSINGPVIFEMVIHDDGTYTFTQNEPLDHSDTTDNNEPIFLDFGVKAVDGDGDTGTGTVRITVLDDSSEANNDSVTLDDTQEVSGNLLNNDSLGADETSTITTISIEGQDYNILPGQENIIETDNGTLRIDPDGSYSYKGKAEGMDSFTYTLTDGDGDTDTAIFKITVEDNQTPININGVGATDDTNLKDDGMDMITGTINVDYQGDAPGTTAGNGEFSSAGNRTDNALSSNGTAVTTNFNAGTNTYTGTANGVTVFTMTINEDGTYKFTQYEPLDHSNTNADNEAIFLDFGITATDSDGDTGDGTVRITVRDDAADANDDKAFTNTTLSSEEHCFDPKQSDVAGTQNSITQDGITLTASNGQDLSWFSDPELGSGVGITGNGSDKVFRSVESLQLDFDHAADGVTISIADMGSNNVGRDFDYSVTLSDGTVIHETVTIDANKVNNGVFEFDVDGYDTDISGITLTGGPSFVLNGVKTIHNDFEAGDAEGNVLLNDDLSADVGTTVTSINFEGQNYDVTSHGTTVEGKNGTLTINSQGQYSYVSNAAPAQTVYSFNKNHPSGRDGAGDIKNVSGDYNSTTNEFNFSFVIKGTDANGFTLVMNDGPNPKNHPGEMAILYFDASNAGEPIISAYGYNGANSFNSFEDGSSAAGIQAPDRILGSNDANHPFSNISVSTDANGNKVFSFSMDATDIIEHTPAYTEGDAEWTGVAFDELMGIWFHPASGLETSYNADGNLTDWNIDDQSWWDGSNFQTETNTIDGTAAGDDTFTYTITDADGDTDTATLEICAKDFDNVIEVDSVGSFSGTSDADLFLFDAIGAGSAEVKNFDLSEDAIDLSAVIQNFDPITDAISDFVHVTERNGDTIISVDQDGNGAGAATEIAAIDGVSGNSLEDLVDNGNIML